MGTLAAPKQAKPATPSRRPEAVRPAPTAWRRPAEGNIAEMLASLVPAGGGKSGAFAGVAARGVAVSRRDDPAELEAESTAARVMRASSGAGVAVAGAGLQRTAGGSADAGPDVGAVPGATGGRALPAQARSFMEPRFGTDFGGVRIHTDPAAARMSRAINAQAFTTGRHIYFGQGMFNPGTAGGGHLLAHELTHTIQQGAVAQGARAAVNRRPAGTVQRGVLGWVREKAANVAGHVPGFRLLTIALESNPITGQAVKRSGANLLRALVELILGGALLTKALDEYGVFEKAGDWLDRQVRGLDISAAAIRQQLEHFLDSLSLSDLAHLDAAWDRLKRILATPAARLVAFVKGCVSGIVAIVKQAVLIPLAKLARATRGYDFLCAVLGADPISGEKVQPNAETLIGGFLKLIGKEEIWDRCKEVNALPRLWAWWESATGELESLGRHVAEQGRQTLRSLEWRDLLPLTRILGKMLGFIGGCIAEYASWAGRALWNVLEIVFDVVAPGLLPYLKKTGAALHGILQNPVPFGRNLSKAGQLGFGQFLDNFMGHLRQGLIQWLTGSLGPDIYLPKAFEVREIFKFLLSILNITWQIVRAKLVAVAGEKAVAACEQGLDIVKTLVKTGIAGAWDIIRESVDKLKEMLFEALYDYVKVQVIKKAVTSVLALLSPVTAVIGAIVKIYNVIKFFVQRIGQIVQVGMAFVDSIVAIAAGTIAPAANRVERVLAGSLALAINFLAAFLGVDDVAVKVREVIGKMRSTIDKALDRLVGWIVKKGGLLLKAGKEKAVAGARKLKEFFFPPKRFAAGREKHTVEVALEGGAYAVYVHSKRRCPGEILNYVKGKAEYRTQADLLLRCAAVEAADKDFAGRTAALSRKRLSGEPGADKKLAAEQAAAGVSYKRLCDAIQELYRLMAEVDGAASKPVQGWRDYRPGEHRGWVLGLSFINRLPGSAPEVEINGGWPGIERKYKEPAGEPPAKKDPRKAMLEILKRITYIRTHLIHHDFGGRGAARNLTPASDSLNRQKMFNAVERPVINGMERHKFMRLDYLTSVTYRAAGTNELPEWNFIAKAVTVKVTKTKDGPGGDKEAAAWTPPTATFENYTDSERDKINELYRRI